MAFPRLHLIFVIFACARLAASVELNFELPDNAKECFFEVIPKNTTCTLEYQVVTGGSYDVDVIMQAPNKELIYRRQKSQYDTHTFVTTQSGEYAICFSNEFSSYSNKMVYMDLQVGEEPRLPGMSHTTVMTQMETSAEIVHKALVTISDYQTHHRLREAQGRKRAEELNETVFWISFMETSCILIISFGQICVLKNFFSEKRPNQFGRK